VVPVFNPAEELVFAADRVHEIGGTQCHVFKIIYGVTVWLRILNS
jgi:hypothetical protein